MEETLFDIFGKPIAYISYDEEQTIYMWNGYPVAYLSSDNTIYGFNGKHLGWYEKGYVRDLYGRIVGFNKLVSNVYTQYEPYKSYKQYRPYRAYKQYARYKPFFTNSRSNESLTQLLMRGRT